MTLAETIKMIEAVASKQPSVNMIVRNDVFRINEKADARYGVFSWLQGQHSSLSSSSYIDFTFTFFYVDRLKDDTKVAIAPVSTAIQVSSIDQFVLAVVGISKLKSHR